MPRPELYVIFTGDRKIIPDTISLSKDFFEGENIAIEAEVKVLYQESEDIIGQYIIFSKVYNEQRKKYGRTEDAIKETIRICKDRNVLKEYLESREKEVIGMMMTLFEEEQIMKAYTKDIMEQGIEKGIKILVDTLKGLGQSKEFILEKLRSEYGLTEQEANKYIS